jgi:hypothetical protein
MRHLRKFNEAKEIPNLIEDILLDITDLGYLSRIEYIFWTKVEGDHDRSDSFQITIYDKKSNSYDGMMYIEEIIDTIESLVSYLESEGYKLQNNSEKKLEFIRLTNKKDPSSCEFKMQSTNIDQYTSMQILSNKKDNKWYISSTSISFEFRK